MNAPRPYTLVAELTYRCPLQCGYCSNPAPLPTGVGDLDTASWCRVMGQAEALGVLQVALTGGEPLLRVDLEEIVAAARSHQLYVNLVTSGLPLTRQRLEALQACGVDSVQLSFQDTDAAAARRMAGGDFIDQKQQVAGWVRELGLPLTVNVVLHRENLPRVDAFIALAERLGAERLELANTQYLGWAAQNRRALLPQREQLEQARAVALAARERLRGQMELLFVTPDLFSDRPRACMNGWGRQYIVVAPDGRALPCHNAGTLPGMTFENVRDHALADIWQSSPAFQRFRGEDWLPQPCKSCDERATDFGGCRCQAFHLLGDAARTDPACALSPDHGIVQQIRREVQGDVPIPLRPRRLKSA